MAIIEREIAGFDLKRENKNRPGTPKGTETLRFGFLPFVSADLRLSRGKPLVFWAICWHGGRQAFNPGLRRNSLEVGLRLSERYFFEAGSFACSPSLGKKESAKEPPFLRVLDIGKAQMANDMSPMVNISVAWCLK